MKPTGIVRRTDDLGRVVIPREIRKKLKIKEGDPLEIFVDRDGEVILKKYSPIVGLEDFAQEYADSLHEIMEHTVIITDQDIIVAGAPKRNRFLGKSIPSFAEDVIRNKNNFILDNTVCVPIISIGDIIGTVTLFSENNKIVGELELKLAETAALFLAKQLEI